MSTKRYVSSAQACDYFQVSAQTLRRWDRDGKITCVRSGPTSHRRYDIDSLRSPNRVREESSESLGAGSKREKKKAKTGIIYCRVSSRHQTDDLARQCRKLHKKYPSYEIIRDIGSGINFRKKGIKTLVERCFERTVDEVVVAHRDRLCRFGYEAYEHFLGLTGARLVVEGQPHVSDEYDNSQQLADDIMSIIQVFACRRNGKRRYQCHKQKSNRQGRRSVEGERGRKVRESCTDPNPHEVGRSKVHL